MSFYLMHRGWMEHHLFKDQPYSDREAWEYLIASANFEETTYRQANSLYKIPRGDIATSYRSLANKWGWSTGKAIRFLKLLKIDEMISLKTEHGFLQITICNYNEYQNPQTKNETETEHGRNTDGTAIDTRTDTNVNNISNINNTTHNAQDYFKAILSAGIEINPDLALKATGIINQWIADGVTPDDAIPEIKRLGHKANAWTYFTSPIMDAKATRLKPLPQGNPRKQSINLDEIRKEVFQ